VLRAIASSDEEFHSNAYCVSVVPGEVAALKDDVARVTTVSGSRQPDASQALLSGVRDLPHRLVPHSACTEDRSGKAILRSSGRGPALWVRLGPVQVTGTDRREVIVYTASGELTDTVIAYQLQRTASGGWRVVADRLLLQE
jgi:hypothetical protein